MKDGFIIILISNKGIQKTKLYHGKDKEATENILRLYERITPYLRRLDRLAMTLGGLSG